MFCLINSSVNIELPRNIKLTLSLAIVDAEKAREKLPSTNNAEKTGKDFGKEAGANIDDAVSHVLSLVLYLHCR